MSKVALHYSSFTVTLEYFFMIKKLTVREISIAAGLSALSIITQLIHIGYQSPQWGMWIDVVAVSWVIAYFIFGLRLSLIVSCIGALMIMVFAPETWLGAIMKLTASVPLILSFALWSYTTKKPLQQFRHIPFLIVPFLVGIVIRCLLVVPLNYYIAIPIWTGMTTAKAIEAIPWYVIVFFNTVQALIDVTFAWIIVYKFKLDRFAKK